MSNEVMVLSARINSTSPVELINMLAGTWPIRFPDKSKDMTDGKIDLANDTETMRLLENLTVSNLRLVSK